MKKADGCGKIGYATHELALQAICHFQSIAKPGQDVPIRTYFCHDCQRYHITSKAKRVHGIKDFLWFLSQYYGGNNE